MEMYGKIRCVTFPELVSQGRILSKPNYDLSSTYKCNFLGADNKQ